MCAKIGEILSIKQNLGENVKGMIKENDRTEKEKTEKMVDEVFSNEFLEKYFGNDKGKKLEEKKQRVEKYRAVLRDKLLGTEKGEDFNLEELVIDVFEENKVFAMRDVYSEIAEKRQLAEREVEKNKETEENEKIKRELEEKYPSRINYRHKGNKDSVAFITRYFYDKEANMWMAEVGFQYPSTRGKKGIKREVESIPVEDLDKELANFEIDREELGKRKSAEERKLVDKSRKEIKVEDIPDRARGGEQESTPNQDTHNIYSKFRYYLGGNLSDHFEGGYYEDIASLYRVIAIIKQALKKAGLDEKKYEETELAKNLSELESMRYALKSEGGVKVDVGLRGFKKAFDFIESNDFSYNGLDFGIKKMLRKAVEEELLDNLEDNLRIRIWESLFPELIKIKPDFAQTSDMEKVEWLEDNIDYILDYDNRGDDFNSLIDKLRELDDYITRASDNPEIIISNDDFKKEEHEFSPEEMMGIEIYEKDAQEMIERIRNIDYVGEYNYDPRDIPAQIEIYIRKYWNDLKKEMLEERRFDSEEKIDFVLNKIKEKQNKHLFIQKNGE